MENITDSRLYNGMMLFTVTGEFILPWILKHYYAGYDSRTMVMSILGSPQSPVRPIYNLWLIWLGGFFCFTAVALYQSIKGESSVLAVLVWISVGLFAIGAGLLSGIFSINEKNGVVTAASKLHETGAAIGFTALLFYPLLDGILSFRQNRIAAGVVGVCSFLAAFVCFLCFIMGDKQQFQNTVLRYEGLWERLTLFCMYMPFLYKAAGNLFDTFV